MLAYVLSNAGLGTFELRLFCSREWALCSQLPSVVRAGLKELVLALLEKAKQEQCRLINGGFADVFCSCEQILCSEFSSVVRAGLRVLVLALLVEDTLEDCRLINGGFADGFLDMPFPGTPQWSFELTPGQCQDLVSHESGLMFHLLPSCDTLGVLCSPASQSSLVITSPV